jgi:hypothetical protein
MSTGGIEMERPSSDSNGLEVRLPESVPILKLYSALEIHFSNLIRPQDQNNATLWTNFAKLE